MLVLQLATRMSTVAAPCSGVLREHSCGAMHTKARGFIPASLISKPSQPCFLGAHKTLQQPMRTCTHVLPTQSLLFGSRTLWDHKNLCTWQGWASPAARGTPPAGHQLSPACRCDRGVASEGCQCGRAEQCCYKEPGIPSLWAAADDRRTGQAHALLPSGCLSVWVGLSGLCGHVGAARGLQENGVLWFGNVSGQEHALMHLLPRGGCGRVDGCVCGTRWRVQWLCVSLHAWS